MSLFVQANIALVDSVNNTQLASGRTIGEMFQRLEMLHGCLEMTVNEMFALLISFYQLTSRIFAARWRSELPSS